MFMILFTVFSRGNLTSVSFQKLVTRSFTTWDTRGAIPFDLACRVLCGGPSCRHILVGPMATPGIRNGAPNFHTKPLWRWFLMHIIVWKTWKCRKLSPFNFNIPFDHLHHHRSTSFGGSTTTLHSWVFPLPLWAI